MNPVLPGILNYCTIFEGVTTVAFMCRLGQSMLPSPLLLRLLSFARGPSPVSLHMSFDKVISPIKARIPIPAGKSKDQALEDDEDEDLDTANVLTSDPDHPAGAVPGAVRVAPGNVIAPQMRRTAGAEVSRPDLVDSAAAIAAAELLHLENLVSMGDGQHDAFTCHCWGLEGALWAVNEPGQLVGTYRSCVGCARGSRIRRMQSFLDSNHPRFMYHAITPERGHETIRSPQMVQVRGGHPIDASIHPDGWGWAITRAPKEGEPTR